MKIEKGMFITQKKTMKALIGDICFSPDNFSPMEWEVKEITNIGSENVYCIRQRNMPPFEIQVSFDAFVHLFTTWTPWLPKKDYCYRHNYKHVEIIKKHDHKTFRTRASCHALDTFDLNEGLKIAEDRLTEKIAKYELKKELERIEKEKTFTTKSSDSLKTTTLIRMGSIIGDYKIIGYAGKDSSRHLLWKCRCEKCGDIKIIRSTSLRNGSKIYCGQCAHKNTLLTPVWGEVNNKETLSGLINSLKCDPVSIVKKEETTLKDNNNFVLEEKRGNLLEAPCYNQIVHVISADYEQEGAVGITKEIIETFGIHNYLVEEIRFLKAIADFENVGLCTEVISHCPTNVLSLIVKENRYDRVDYHTIEIGLHNLKKIVNNRKISYLAMPRICCGKEKLDWEIVKDMIIKEFKDVEHKLTITVYNK